MFYYSLSSIIYLLYVYTFIAFMSNSTVFNTVIIINLYSVLLFVGWLGMIYSHSVIPLEGGTRERPQSVCLVLIGITVHFLTISLGKYLAMVRSETHV